MNSQRIDRRTLLADLPIGNPARSAFAEIGVIDLQGLAKWTKRDALALHGVGPKAIGILEEALAEAGLSFAGE